MRQPDSASREVIARILSTDLGSCSEALTLLPCALLLSLTISRTSPLTHPGIAFQWTTVPVEGSRSLEAWEVPEGLSVESCLLPWVFLEPESLSFCSLAVDVGFFSLAAVCFEWSAAFGLEGAEACRAERRVPSRGAPSFFFCFLVPLDAAESSARSRFSDCVAFFGAIVIVSWPAINVVLLSTQSVGTGDPLKSMVRVDTHRSVVT